jgi:hypothetical protein
MRGINLLQRTGTLPEVWIPRLELRDWLELSRAQIVVQQRTRLNNRIHAMLAKYALTLPAVSDFLGIRHHLEWPKAITIICSPQSIRQVHWFGDILRRYHTL